MDAATKINLSEKELTLVSNADWILTKQIITQKVTQLFSEMVPVIKGSLLNESLDLPAEIKSSVPKIYKGENYLQLPYVMLDYPRSFNKENIFALRTMFWWANFFSITLHVSGTYIQEVKNKIIKNKSLLESDFYIGVNENQWEHHFEKNNFLQYRQLDQEQMKKLFDQDGFIKLALKFNLHDWNQMQKLLSAAVEKIAKLLD